MPGDEWQKLANLRLLFGYMYAQPAKKLLFMGGEFGQWSEWRHDGSLDWYLLDYDRHAAVQKWVQELNRVYSEQPALHELDCEQGGFEWIDASDALQSTISFIRQGKSDDTPVLAVCNFTPTVHTRYQVGAPCGGKWVEILNSDAVEYGGSGQRNPKSIEASTQTYHGRPYSLTITLPPLAIVLLKPEK
jgi:1,4-alpha-glucan branching enzyme